MSVSLDKRAIPQGLWPEGSRAPGLIWPALGIFVVLLLMGKVPGAAAVNAAIRGFCERHNIELYDKLAYRYRCVRMGMHVCVLVCTGSARAVPRMQRCQPNVRLALT